MGKLVTNESGNYDVLMKIYQRPKIVHFFIFELFEGIKLIIFSVLWPRWPLWKPLRTKLSPHWSPIWPSDLLVRYANFDFQKKKRHSSFLNSQNEYFDLRTNWERTRSTLTWRRPRLAAATSARRAARREGAARPGMPCSQVCVLCTLTSYCSTAFHS